MKIKEIIIVEGRDDTAAIKRAVEAETIETHGYGISSETWMLIEKAYKDRGIIILTDPDHAGEEIRKRLSDRFPDAKQANISADDAESSGDIGVENASPHTLRYALEMAGSCTSACGEEFSMQDLVNNGLSGVEDSASLRRDIGSMLGIGYGNSSRFLKKLNGYGITRNKFDEALLACRNKRDK